ncbi:MAG: hypothetical protein J7K98_01385 [Candidatus Aenigmarchaeota archaeon]|nr:hypothetical protein [Candidatus Aenigmarchaeota archaeon]
MVKDKVVLDPYAFKSAKKRDKTIYLVYKLGESLEYFKRLSEKTGMHFDITLLRSGTLSGRASGELICTYGHKHEENRGELYFVLKNECMIELYDETSRETLVLSLPERSYIFIHPKFFHRLIAGKEDCVVLGIVPKDAGHDYSVVKNKGFPFHVFYDSKRGMLKYVHNPNFSGVSLLIDKVLSKSSLTAILKRINTFRKLLFNPKTGRSIYYLG